MLFVWLILRAVIAAFVRYFRGKQGEVDPYSLPIGTKVDPYHNGVSYAVSYWSDMGMRPYQEDRHQEWKGPLTIAKHSKDGRVSKDANIDKSIFARSRSISTPLPMTPLDSPSITTNGRSQNYCSLFGVFDGHGGYRAAQTCKDELLQRIATDPALPLAPETAIRNAFFRVDADFSAWARLEKHSDGSTAIVAVLQDGQITIGNAGDSRAILIKKTPETSPRAGVSGAGTQSPQLTMPSSAANSTNRQSAYQVDVLPLSSDHKPNRPDEESRIKKLGGKVTHWGRWRVQGVLAVSRAIGDVALQPYVTCEPEITSHSVNPEEDLFLVLASDGVWDVMSNHEAGVTVMQAAMTKRWEDVARELCLHAKALGSQDNVTAQVIDLTQCFCPPPQK